jgi:putative hydrolase
VAQVTATGGQPEANVEPLTRIEYTDLARIAAPQVEIATSIGSMGSSPTGVEPTTVTPGAWAQRTLDDYRPLFTELATALGQQPPAPDTDPFASMFAGLTGMIAPVTMGMTIGSMVGLLARKSLGQYDLPLPRPTATGLMIVPTTVDAFAAEWELPVRDVRMFTLIHELVIHHLYSVPHIREAVGESVRRHVGAFRPDPQAVADKLTAIDAGDPASMMESLQKVLGDPELLLGAVRSPEQDRLQPAIDALLALVIGWADHMTDVVSERILGNPGRIAEALRRRRIERGDETAFVERLLGLQLTQRQVERGRSFVRGVIDRAGDDGLLPLYRDVAALPTPAEIDAPGLWLARLEISSD